MGELGGLTDIKSYKNQHIHQKCLGNLKTKRLRVLLLKSLSVCKNEKKIHVLS